MGHIHLDFETFSTLDLSKVGADVYSSHSTTDILCLAYCIDAGPVEIWKAGDQDPMDLLLSVADNFPVVGHNVGAFEVLIWNNVCTKRWGWPPLKIENCEDTMAMSYSMAMPGSLDGASTAAGLDIEKDMKGRRVMLQLCKPKADGTIWSKEDYPEKYKILYEYCKTDVEVERALYKRLMKLSPSETELWHLDWKINRRGVQIDTEALHTAITLVEQVKDNYDLEMRRITEGYVCSCSATSQLRAWLINQGLDVPSIAKADVIDMLERDIPANCRQALELRQQAAKTSTAKLQAMLKGVDEDGRIRGLFQYNGASTGRWAGRRIQLHNLPRPNLCQDDIEDVFKILRKVSSGSRRKLHNN